VFRFCRVCLITVRVCGMLRPFLLMGEVYQARTPVFRDRASRPRDCAPHAQVNSKLLAPCPLSLWLPTAAVIFHVSTPAVDEACQAMSWSNGIYLATIGVCQWSPSMLCQVAEIPQHGARKRVHIRAFSGRTETLRFMGMSH
jgi:hypothetical protein